MMINRKSNLPKESVDILKKWLYYNFKSPYPNEIQKKELSLQADITVNQVNNWFVNSRVRIWKPILALVINSNKKIDDKLKNWIFDHFDNPEPTEEEKELLLKISNFNEFELDNWILKAKNLIIDPLKKKLLFSKKTKSRGIKKQKKVFKKVITSKDIKKLNIKILKMKGSIETNEKKILNFQNEFHNVLNEFSLKNDKVLDDIHELELYICDK